MSEAKRMKTNTSYMRNGHEVEHDWIDSPVHGCDKIPKCEPVEEVLTPADLGNHIDFDAMRPELKPGDRVHHATLGDGQIGSVVPEQGIATVYFSANTVHHVALSLLTKIEPEPKTLQDQLHDEFEAQLTAPNSQAGAGTFAGAAMLLFRDHFDSKREEILNAMSVWGNEDADDDGLIARLRSILFGYES